MGKMDWNVQFCWVEAFVRIQGNELANTLAKEAVMNADVIESYKKVSKNVVQSEIGGISVAKWQRNGTKRQRAKLQENTSR
jgi:hypothetical protein